MHVIPMLGFNSYNLPPIRYKGYLLLEQPNNGWLVRPERSPMKILPFRTANCSLEDVKILLDNRLSTTAQVIQGI